MTRAARQQSEQPAPPEVLVVARGLTRAGVPCVAALVVQGRSVRHVRMLEEAQEAAAADRTWREWAWRLLCCGEAIPDRAPPAELRTAKGCGLAKSGKRWGAVVVALDAEGLEPDVVAEADTKAEAWDELDRWAGLNLLHEERRARLGTGGKRK